MKGALKKSQRFGATILLVIDEAVQRSGNSQATKACCSLLDGGALIGESGENMGRLAKKIWTGQWLPILLVPLVIGTAIQVWARGDEQFGGKGRLPPEKLTEVALTAASGATFKIPAEYGRLVNVVVSSDVHYLYFEDDEGTVHIVLLGPRGAAQRSRSAPQLLSPEVFRIERTRGPGTQDKSDAPNS